MVLGRMGLTGGHHPKREATASLTSPIAHASALTLIIFFTPTAHNAQLYFVNAFFFFFFLRVLLFFSPTVQGPSQATPLEHQVVPAIKQKNYKLLAHYFTQLSFFYNYNNIRYRRVIIIIAFFIFYFHLCVIL